MNGRRFREWCHQHPYSQEYHLGRLVRCVDCDKPLHKDYAFVQHGYRCYECWLAVMAAMGHMAIRQREVVVDEW